MLAILIKLNKTTSSNNSERKIEFFSSAIYCPFRIYHIMNIMLFKITDF